MLPDLLLTRHAVDERVADIVMGCSIAILGTLFAFRKRARIANAIARTRAS